MVVTTYDFTSEDVNLSMSAEIPTPIEMAGSTMMMGYQEDLLRAYNWAMAGDVKAARDAMISLTEGMLNLAKECASGDLSDAEESDVQS